MSLTAGAGYCQAQIAMVHVLEQWSVMRMPSRIRRADASSISLGTTVIASPNNATGKRP